MRLTEQSLFEEIPLAAADTAVCLITPEPSKLLPIEDAGRDWNEDFELIEDLIGTEAALKIAEAFSGSTIYVPKNIFASKTYCDIRKEHKAGKSYRELGLKYGYTERHVRRIVHNKRGFKSLKK